MDGALDGVPETERPLMGSLVQGKVVAVHRWGVLVDLGLSHMGFIDPLYIDDEDSYVVGAEVDGYLSSYQARTEKYWLRPPGQVPIAHRYPE